MEPEIIAGELMKRFMGTEKKPGRCYLVGAGPGDLGLVTLRAKQLVEQAEVVIYDYLCNPEILQWAPESAEIIFAGKRRARTPCRRRRSTPSWLKSARTGKQVVRLKAAIHSCLAAAGRGTRRWPRPGFHLKWCPV